MKQLISQIRQTLPFGLPESQLCADECKGCSLKLLEFLDIELTEKEQRLQQGEVPSLGDVHPLGCHNHQVIIFNENAVME